MTEKQVARFMIRVDKSAGDDSCWPWRGQMSRSGYGKFAARWDGDRHFMRAHRVMWALEFGDIPDGMFVCHRCDNRSCVNPRHLFLGSPADNSSDMAAKGRVSRVGPANPARGEQCHKAKLTVSDVSRMRDLAAAGRTHESLAQEFGLTQGAASAAITGRTWKHVPGALSVLSHSQSGSRRRSA